MTAYQLVTLTCDRCGEIYDGGIHTKVRDCRDSAAASGWRYERHQDRCRNCVQRGRKWPTRNDRVTAAESGGSDSKDAL